MRNLNEVEMKNKLIRFGIELVEAKIPTDPKQEIEFTIRKKDSEASFTYRMKHQKTLNNGANQTIADFYFERIDSTGKPIAVYLDGFRYHAGPQTSDRLSSDFVKREALFNGDGVQKHIVWNMNWKDIETFEREPEDHPARYFDIECSDKGDFLGLNPMAQLFRVMLGEMPNNSFMNLVKAVAQTKFTQAKCSSDVLRALSEVENAAKVHEAFTKALQDNQGSDLAIIFSKTEDHGFAYLIRKSGVVSFLYFKSPQAVRETGLFYENWERLLYTFNILQLISDELIIRVWAQG